MANFLIPVTLLTQEDMENRRKYHEKRNLYNKYTSSQLENWINVDLYEALDLDCYRECEIPTDILNYCVRRKSISYHPTKNRRREEAFLIITKAGEILSNSRFRKVYDSCHLDESLPEDKEYSLSEFLDTFDDVFIRNAIFSEIKPVPRITEDPETFYKFWQTFKTTRVYDEADDVFNVTGSFRRYAAEKKKESLQDKKLKDLRRIQALFKLAIKCDPRIAKKNTESSNWNDTQLKTLKRFDSLTAKSSNRYEVIAKKLNDLYLTKRSPSEIKIKLESLKKK